MKISLDTSVLLAACGSSKGASRAVFNLAPAQDWTLVTSAWVVGEAVKNLDKFPLSVTAEWTRLRRGLVVVDDVVSLDRPVIFEASKDRPILFTALAGRIRF